ncbi:hypothetical protein [Hymenobacter convexus]|uniref:hypothetical protein n=1 Tax=Hymenobacter sp. CA1UV-4 TaxID=3063782 RepID=UPI00271297BB|nr:hypothetical protein [Hymenobacter sp. CA1UV-4]MDO7854501.1 hypothetical protein [Hymenobacter sp. CA1UV-4]
MAEGRSRGLQSPRYSPAAAGRAAGAAAAGSQYRYYLVFDKLAVPGAQRLDTFGALLAEL